MLMHITSSKRAPSASAARTMTPYPPGVHPLLKRDYSTKGAMTIDMKVLEEETNVPKNDCNYPQTCAFLVQKLQVHY